jgi:YD repeat-containing protein
VGVVTAVVPTVRRIPILGIAPIAATTTTNYDNLGEVTSVTAPGGAVSRYGYDVLGRSVSATAAYGTSLAGRIQRPTPRESIAKQAKNDGH